MENTETPKSNFFIAPLPPGFNSQDEFETEAVFTFFVLSISGNKERDKKKIDKNLPDRGDSYIVGPLFGD